MHELRPGPEELGDQGDCFDEASTALAVLSAETLHEITYTLSFLRLLALQPDELPAAEVARFVQSELDRMQRLAAHLRRFKLPPPQLDAVPLRLLTEECIAQLRGPLESREVQAETRVPADCAARTDGPCLRSALRHLLLATIEQAPPGSRLLISATVAPVPNEQPVQLELSTEGPGPADLRWWELCPLGTPSSRRLIAHKLLRHIGWSLTEQIEPTRTLLRLTAPTTRRLS